MINPWKNDTWTIPAAIVPAVLATILIFMDQQITAVIVNRREHLLKKGRLTEFELIDDGLVANLEMIASFRETVAGAWNKICFYLFMK